jgi:hypothetical protein
MRTRCGGFADLAIREALLMPHGLETRFGWACNCVGCGNNPSRLLPCAGPGWWAVGDAAWTAQPLASCGIAKSLADAHQCSIAISQAATYDTLLSARFKRYLQELKSQFDAGRSANASKYDFAPHVVFVGSSRISTGKNFSSCAVNSIDAPSQIPQSHALV